MPERFGSNESTYDALRMLTTGAAVNPSGNADATYLRLDTTNDPLTGPLDVHTDNAHALRVLTAAGVEVMNVSTTLNTLRVNAAASSAIFDLVAPNTAGLYSVLHLYDNGNQGWAITKNPTTRDLWINKDTTYGGYVLTALAIQHASGRVIVGPVNLPTFSADAQDILHVKGHQYTAVRIDGTTHGQLLLAANGVNQWSIYSQSDTVLRFYKTPGTAGDVMTLTDAGNLATVGTVQGTQLKSTMAIGTAPLTVVSTTVVTNLNADTVDGYHSGTPAIVGNASAANKLLISGAGPGFDYAESVGTLNLGAYNVTIPASGTVGLMNYENSGQFIAKSDGGIIARSDTLNTGQRMLQVQYYNTAATFIVTQEGAVSCSNLRINTVDYYGAFHCVAGAAAFDYDTNADPPAQFVMRGQTDTNKQMIIGINTTSNYAAIQAIWQGNTVLPFALNQFGGNVGIGTAAPATQLHIVNTQVTTNAPVEVARLEARVASTGVGAAGFGPALDFYAETSVDTTYRQIGRVMTTLTTATDASRQSAVAIQNVTAAGSLVTRILADGPAITLTGSQAGSYATTAIDLTLDNTHHFLTVTAAKTITLPTAVGCTGREYLIKATIDGVIVDGNGAETIDNEATQTMFAYDCIQVKSTGTGWMIV